MMNENENVIDNYINLMKRIHLTLSIWNSCSLKELAKLSDCPKEVLETLLKIMIEKDLIMMDYKTGEFRVIE